MVGVKGFEPPAPCSQSTYATKLRYTPLDPVAVTAVGFAPDDEIYLTIPASICQHLFSIFPKKLLHLPLTVPPLFFPQDLFKGSPLRGAVRRRAGLKGCPMGRGQGGGLASPSPISAPNQLFELLRCFAWLIQLRQRTALSPLKRSCFRFAPLTLRCRSKPALRAAPVFRSAYSAPTAHCAVSSETLDLQVLFAHPPMPHRTSSSSCSGVSHGLFMISHHRPSCSGVPHGLFSLSHRLQNAG